MRPWQGALDSTATSLGAAFCQLIARILLGSFWARSTFKGRHVEYTPSLTRVHAFELSWLLLGLAIDLFKSLANFCRFHAILLLCFERRRACHGSFCWAFLSASLAILSNSKLVAFFVWIVGSDQWRWQFWINHFVYTILFLDLYFYWLPCLEWNDFWRKHLVVFVNACDIPHCIIYALPLRWCLRSLVILATLLSDDE